MVGKYKSKGNRYKQLLRNMRNDTDNLISFKPIKIGKHGKR